MSLDHERRGWCGVCGAVSVVHKRSGSSFLGGVGHIILTVVTVGAWLAVLLIIRVRDAFRPWRCVTCGAKASKSWKGHLQVGAAAGSAAATGCGTCGRRAVRGNGKCPACGGTGSQFDRYLPSPLQEQECDACGGSGICPSCHGTGLLSF